MRSAAVRQRHVWLALATLAGTALALSASAGTGSGQLRQAIACLVDLSDRIVRVRTLIAIRIDPKKPESLVYEYSYGTGVLLPDPGLVATVQHLVRARLDIPEGEQEVAIMTRDSAGYLPVDVIAEDAESDLAILSANRRAVPRDKSLQPDFDALAPIGADAYVLGIRAAAPPENFEVGVISGRFVEGEKQLVEVGGDSYRDRPWLAVSQKILPGYSGGAILNADGAFVAIIVGAPFHSDQWTDFSFGIGIEALAPLLKRSR